MWETELMKLMVQVKQLQGRMVWNWAAGVGGVQKYCRDLAVDKGDKKLKQVLE